MNQIYFFIFLQNNNKCKVDNVLQKRYNRKIWAEQLYLTCHEELDEGQLFLICFKARPKKYKATLSIFG